MVVPGRRSPLLAALLVALLLPGCGAEGDRARRVPNRPPNVVLLVVDTLRADHVGGYGYERDTTPHLDRLIGEGARFDAAIAHSSWSPPSHASIITGVLPSRHRIRGWGDALPKSVVPLAVHLRRRGYTCGLFSSHFSLHSSVGGIREGIDHAAVERNRDRVVLGKAAAWATRQTRPFFLYIVIMAPHAPYRRHPPAWDEALFTDMPPGGERRYPFAETVWWGQGAIPTSVQIEGEHRVGEYVNRYDRGVRWADTLIGSFLAHMRAAKRMDDTLLIVTSDHGEGLGEHGVFAHEVFLYDFLVRVPLVIHYPPHVAGGLVVDEQVQLVDIVPTVLGLIGGASPEGLDGLDLSPRLRGEQARLPERFALARYANRGLQRLMVRSQDFKLIYDPLSGAEEFYQLATDPREERNLVEPELPPALRTPYEAHRDALRGLLVDSARDEPRPPAELTEEVREELRSLGYLE